MDQDQTDGQGQQAATVSDRAGTAGERHPYPYDHRGHIRAQRLRLAWKYRQDGATDDAIAVFSDMLDRYAGTGAADAAAEEMLEMATALEQQGECKTALHIVRTVESYYWP